MTNLLRFFKLAVLLINFSICFPAIAISSWPTFPITSDCVLGSAYGNQTSPSVARGETNLLVVWDDERITGDKDIFCARVTPEGEVLDAVGIPVCTVWGPQESPEVAAGDQCYLAVWRDERNDWYDIYGARIDMEGNVLDPDGFEIYSGTGWAESPEVAWDGINFFVVWTDDRNMISPDIYGTRISPAGEILDDSSIQISSSSLIDLAPSVAYNGLNYLVVWEVGSG
jgi:hypothetical protein